MRQRSKAEYFTQPVIGSAFDAYRELIEAGEAISPSQAAEEAAARIMAAVQLNRNNQIDLCA